MINEYEPFGDNWRREMNQFTKAELIELLRNVLMNKKINDFRESDIPDYDCGLIDDYGGGNVSWWQNYIKAEVGRANDHWRSIIKFKKD